MKQVIDDYGWCSVALPGGSFVRPLYDELGLLQLRWDLVEFFFTDERAVRPDHPASNYGEALDRLFTNPRIQLHQVHRIEGEGADLDSVADLYERELPESFDVMILGLEANGAIAAIHPDSVAFDDPRRVVPVQVVKKPHRRVTLAPREIQAAGAVCVVAEGVEVGPALRAALGAESVGAANECPARLVREATWFVDRAAARALD